MDPMNWENSQSLLSTEDCETPQKRRKLDPANSSRLQSFTDNSCCLKEINQEVMDQSRKDKNILKFQTAVDKQIMKELEIGLEESRDSSLESPETKAEIKKEITEIKRKNMELLTENAQLKELLIHQTTEHESERIAAQKEIIELQDKLKSNSLSQKDIAFIRVQLETTKDVIEKLISQNKALLDESKKLLSKAARADIRARALEEELKSSRGEDQLQEKAATQDQFCENAESLKQQAAALKTKCDELISKVRNYAKGEGYKLMQDSSSDELNSDANDQDHESPSEQMVEDKSDGTVGKVTEMEQEEQSCHHLIQDSSPGQLTPDANDEDESSPEQRVDDDPDGTDEKVAETGEEKNCTHFIQDPGSDKLTSDANDKDESLSRSIVEDDPDGTVGSVVETTPREPNRHQLIQDPSSDEPTPDTANQDESSSGKSVDDDPDGTVEKAAETEQGEQNRKHFIQDPNSDKLTSDANDEDAPLSRAPVEDDPDGTVGSVIEVQQREQNLRITIGRHDYLVSDAKFSDIIWKREYIVNYGGGTKIKCRRCQKQSANLHLIQDHIWSNHYGERFECAYCEDHSKPYSSRVNLKNHIHKDHPEVCRCKK